MSASRLAAFVMAAGAICATLAPASAAAQEPVAAGRIRVVSGAAFVVRNGTESPAQAGQIVYQSDTLRTGSDGRLGVTLKDDTRVSLGPATDMRVDRFVYAPAAGQLGLVLRLVKGVAAYVSGHIAKLAPDAVRLETPAAIVGVRGTTIAMRVVPQ
jgi:hypothetical protein